MGWLFDGYLILGTDENKKSQPQTSWLAKESRRPEAYELNPREILWKASYQMAAIKHTYASQNQPAPVKRLFISFSFCTCKCV